ncbi:MAG: hypothetical protein Q9181_006080 [Wetmoreana brouardii]
MSAKSFSFPPPPPPPQQAPHEPISSLGNSFSRGRGDKRWERGPRGRGRGNSHRGARGGGGNTSYGASYATSNESDYGRGSYPLPNYPPVQQPQYPANSRNGYNNATALYAPVASHPIPHQAYPYYPPYQNAQPQAVSYPYGPPSYNSQEHNYPYQGQHEPPQHTSSRYASPPVAMGPPIRWGFGGQSIEPRPFPPGKRGPTEYNEAYSSFSSEPPHRQSSPHGPRRGGNRPLHRYRGGRGHQSTRGNRDVSSDLIDSSRKTQVAPAVPSFGNPLPVRPPTPKVEAKKPKKKKKRRVNQLGLTPRTEEHISSSEDEEGIDEESKLAASVGVAGTAGQQLQFTYKGQTSTLQSSSDIASWIEERKKLFPTAARRAEKETEQQKAKEEKEEKRRAYQAEKLLERQKKTLEKDKHAAAEKAKLKVEKLREKLRKEERRVAKAEAKSLKRRAEPEASDDLSPEVKRKKSDNVPKTNNSADPSDTLANIKHGDKDRELSKPTSASYPDSMHANNGTPNGTQTTFEKIRDEERPSSIPDPLTPTSQPALPDQEVQRESKSDSAATDSPAITRETLPQTAADDYNAPDAGTMEGGDAGVTALSSSSDTFISTDDESDDDDDESTSSGGSDSSSSSDSDAAGPETAPSRRSGPQKVPAPRRKGRQDKPICRDFLRAGRCRRGNRCRWRHALPERGHKRAEEESLSRPQRKSLHQRVCRSAFGPFPQVGYTTDIATEQLVDQEVGKEREEKQTIEQQDQGIEHDA